MRVLAWILGTLVACCACISACAQSPDAPASGASTAPMQYLDLAHPSLNWTVGSSQGAAGRPGTSGGVPEASGDPSARFVRVDIAEVLNPEVRGLVFDVAYRPDQGPEINLGSFSLYPSDRPGRFIVPTQSHVKAGGSIVVTMTVLDAAKVDQRLRVCVRSVALISGLDENH
jgi:hypothetical protein